MNNLIITKDGEFSEEDLLLLSNSENLMKAIEENLGRPLTKHDMGARWVEWGEGAVLDDNAESGLISVFAESAWTPCVNLMPHILKLVSADKIVNTYFETANGFAGVDVCEKSPEGVVEVVQNIDVGFSSDHLPYLDTPIIKVNHPEDLKNSEVLSLLRTGMWDGALVEGTSDDYFIAISQAVEYIIDPLFINTIDCEEKAVDIKKIALLIDDVVDESVTVDLKKTHSYDLSVAAEAVLTSFQKVAEKDGFSRDVNLLHSASSRYATDPESDCTM